MKIYLIGMPAVGKSSVGRILAKRTNRSFIDLDMAIVERAGCSVRRIFEQEGEWGFRVREAAALVELGYHGSHELVIATGGGAPCFGQNLKVMRQTGFTIYLQAELETLEKRKGLLERPLLAANKRGPAYALRSLFRRRRSFYEQAEMRLLTDGHTPLVLAKAIIGEING